jgi:hypothetical protein
MLDDFFIDFVIENAVVDEYIFEFFHLGDNEVILLD